MHDVSTKCSESFFPLFNEYYTYDDSFYFKSKLKLEKTTIRF